LFELVENPSISVSTLSGATAKVTPGSVVASRIGGHFQQQWQSYCLCSGHEINF
jgi:hypothetical protein